MQWVDPIWKLSPYPVTHSLHSLTNHSRLGERRTEGQKQENS